MKFFERRVRCPYYIVADALLFLRRDQKFLVLSAAGKRLLDFPSGKVQSEKSC